jgi:hypothetical protein
MTSLPGDRLGFDPAHLPRASVIDILATVRAGDDVQQHRLAAARTVRLRIVAFICFRRVTVQTG